MGELFYEYSSIRLYVLYSSILRRTNDTWSTDVATLNAPSMSAAIRSLISHPIQLHTRFMHFRVNPFRIVISLRLPVQPPGPKRFYTSTSAHEPLRILFCGSDEFSIASLRALNDERLRDPKAIQSLDVVCRPGKPIGRGLKKIREGMSMVNALKECFAGGAYSTDCKSCYWSPSTPPRDWHFYQVGGMIP